MACYYLGFFLMVVATGLHKTKKGDEKQGPDHRKEVWYILNIHLFFACAGCAEKL